MAKRIAALYDIHGNLPALDAVLEEVRRAGFDHIVVDGDVLPGPMVRETLACLHELDVPVQFVQGNCEVAVLVQIVGSEPAWYRSVPADAKSHHSLLPLLFYSTHAMALLGEADRLPSGGMSSSSDVSERRNAATTEHLETKEMSVRS